MSLILAASTPLLALGSYYGMSRGSSKFGVAMGAATFVVGYFCVWDYFRLKDKDYIAKLRAKREQEFLEKNMRPIDKLPIQSFFPPDTAMMACINEGEALLGGQNIEGGVQKFALAVSIVSLTDSTKAQHLLQTFARMLGPDIFKAIALEHQKDVPRIKELQDSDEYLAYKRKSLEQKNPYAWLQKQQQRVVAGGSQKPQKEETITIDELEEDSIDEEEAEEEANGPKSAIEEEDVVIEEKPTENQVLESDQPSSYQVITPPSSGVENSQITTVETEKEDKIEAPLTPPVLVDPMDAEKLEKDEVDEEAQQRDDSPKSPSPPLQTETSKIEESMSEIEHIQKPEAGENILQSKQIPSGGDDDLHEEELA